MTVGSIPSAGDALKWSPGTVSDVDDTWTPSRAWELREYDIVSDRTFWYLDAGIRPLLLDLAKTGHNTTSSNLASSGSEEAAYPWLMFRGNAPRRMLQAVDRRAPDGWSATMTGYGDTVMLVPDECSDMKWPPGSCRSVSPRERLVADRAFVKGVRDSL